MKITLTRTDYHMPCLHVADANRGRDLYLSPLHVSISAPGEWLRLSPLSPRLSITHNYISYRPYVRFYVLDYEAHLRARAIRADLPLLLDRHPYARKVAARNIRRQLRGLVACYKRGRLLAPSFHLYEKVYP